MKYTTLIFSILFSANAMAQECVGDINNTSSSDNFIEHENGTATDITTGLTWMQCSLGQTWDSENSTCIGSATPMTWQQALNTSLGYEYADSMAWRVPNLKELTTLVERACVRPAINVGIFPNTPADDFWTSSPSVTDMARTWVVAFFSGSNAIKDKELDHYVRLVRTAD